MRHARANLVTPTTQDGAATRNPRASGGGGTDMQRAVGAPAAINRAAPLVVRPPRRRSTGDERCHGEGRDRSANRDTSSAGVPNDTRAETGQERMQSTGFRGHPGRQEHIRAKIERVQGNSGRPCSDRVLSRSREGTGLPRTGAGETAHGDAAPARCGANAPTAPTKRERGGSSVPAGAACDGLEAEGVRLQTHCRQDQWKLASPETSNCAALLRGGVRHHSESAVVAG